jgi:hypothetical protein
MQYSDFDGKIIFLYFEVFSSCEGKTSDKSVDRYYQFNCGKGNWLLKTVFQMLGFVLMMACRL